MCIRYLFILNFCLILCTAYPETNANVNLSAETYCIFDKGCDDMAGVRSFIKEEDDEEENRIIGGQDSWAHSWPWQVSLQYSEIPACGGAIIDQRWIITASHCFRRYKKASLWTAVVGRHDLENANESCHETVNVEKIISHEDYNQKTNENDVALLKLSSPLRFNPCVRPVAIWNDDVQSLETCTVTGWGAIRENGPRASKLQEVNVTVFEAETCVLYFGGKMYKYMMCAGADTGGMDACQGDSGGPLSCFTGERYKLVGVVSWGVGCGRAKKPGVYTQLYHYKQWIDSAIHAECGLAKVDPCQLPAGSARLISSDDGTFKADGVVESCPHFWPWHVSLQSGDVHYCSGVLIHPYWVLAPRHCFVKVGDVVFLGAHDLNFMSGQILAVQSVQSLPYDNVVPSVSDLSMIRLTRPARIGATIFPVCLMENDDDVVNEEGFSCVTTGWGLGKATMDLSPDVLHMAVVKLLSEKDCKAGWGENISKKSLLCTDAAASTSCSGDAGAPLVCQKNGLYYLVGVTAGGGKRCEPRKPALFTRVSAFYSWIQTWVRNS